MAHVIAERNAAGAYLGPRKGPHGVPSNPQGKAGPPSTSTSDCEDTLKRFSRVLVVDDDDGVRRQLCYLLEDEGYHVQAAATGLSALSVLDHARFDIVILDVRLPDVSGIEVFEAFRQRPQPIKTIIVSGFLGDQEIAAAETRGAHFLAKPVDSQRLLTLLASLQRAKGDTR
jgi:CheY-like chemotaxis protein